MKQREIVRTIHLIGSASIGTFIYSPLRNVDWFVYANQILVIPLLAITGLWLWKGHIIKKKLFSSAAI